MRRWMCLALSLLMLAFCASAWAESGEWKYDADYAILRGYEGEGGDVVVPGELEGYTVDVIDINVFKSDVITSLTLPETVLELRSNAVTWCENLKSVSLPESLIVINRMNFNTCDSLNEVTIPAGVRYIGSNSFRFCGALKKVTFEGVCPIIDKECFSLLGEGATAYVPDDQLEAERADQKARQHDDDHKDRHLTGVGQHGGEHAEPRGVRPAQRQKRRCRGQQRLCGIGVRF